MTRNYLITKINQSFGLEFEGGTPRQLAKDSKKVKVKYPLFLVRAADARRRTRGTFSSAQTKET